MMIMMIMMTMMMTIIIIIIIITIERVRPYIATRFPVSTQAVSGLGNTQLTSTRNKIK